jgi:transcription elongation factor Elf1
MGGKSMRVDTCEVCGARYQVVKTVIIMRDTDFFNCERCGTKLLDWNSAVIYDFIRLPDKDEGSKGEEGDSQHERG